MSRMHRYIAQICCTTLHIRFSVNYSTSHTLEPLDYIFACLWKWPTLRPDEEHRARVDAGASRPARICAAVRSGARDVTTSPRGTGRPRATTRCALKRRGWKCEEAVRRGVRRGSSSGSVDLCSVDSSGARTGAGCTAARTERRQSFIM